MANIKSAEKKARQSEKKNLQNRMVKSRMNTEIKKFKEAVATKEFKLAEELLRVVSGLLDGGAQDGVIHKNKADRNKANFAKMLHKAKEAK